MNSIGSAKGCPIRESPNHSLFPAPRSVSSVSTPFFVFGCLGIHHKPFFIWPFSCNIPADFVICTRIIFWRRLCLAKLTKKAWMVEISGLEPLTSALQRQRSTNWAIPPWWAMLDLNQRPHPYQGCALTNWANSPLLFYFVVSMHHKNSFALKQSGAKKTKRILSQFFMKKKNWELSCIF